jgi:hypothetical protein
MQGVETGVIPLGQAGGLFEGVARAVREVGGNENGFEFTAIPQDLAKKGWKLKENLPQGRS